MKNFIDLTYYIEEGMTTFNAPWHPLVSIQQLGRHGFEGRETRKITLGTHTGTHVDAPLHFVRKGKSIDEVALEKMIGEVNILDFTYMNENEGVTKNMLVGVTLGKKLLFKFGWGKHWGDKKYYMNYPYITEEAAEYLVSMNVELIALDTPSPDDSMISPKDPKDSLIHKIFLKNNVILVEYLANTEQIKDYEGWKLIVMPLKIKGADGAPARVCIYK